MIEVDRRWIETRTYPAPLGKSRLDPQPDPAARAAIVGAGA